MKNNNNDNMTEKNNVNDDNRKGKKMNIIRVDKQRIGG